MRAFGWVVRFARLSIHGGGAMAECKIEAPSLAFPQRQTLNAMRFIESFVARGSEA